MIFWFSRWYFIWLLLFHQLYHGWRNGGKTSLFVLIMSYHNSLSVCVVIALHSTGSEPGGVYVGKMAKGKKFKLYEYITLSSILKYILHPGVNDISVILSLSCSLSLYSSSWMSCTLSLIGLFFSALNAESSRLYNELNQVSRSTPEVSFNA